jgi:hypothetical protein
MTLMDLAHEVDQLRLMLAGVDDTLASPHASPRPGIASR